jgi:hypothetical protein
MRDTTICRLLDGAGSVFSRKPPPHESNEMRQHQRASSNHHDNQNFHNHQPQLFTSLKDCAAARQCLILRRVLSGTMVAIQWHNHIWRVIDVSDPEGIPAAYGVLEPIAYPFW